MNFNNISQSLSFLKSNKILFYLSVSLLFCVFFTACEGEEEPFPAYIHVKAAQVATDYQLHGTNSHKLNASLILVETDKLGLYDMPHSQEIPVLLYGDREVTIKPFFWNNGISSTPVSSPLHRSFVAQVNLNPLEIDTISPIFTYNDGVEMLLNNDFETGNNFEAKLGTKAAELITVGAFEGSRAAKISLTPTDTVFRFGSQSTFDLPFGNAATYLEVDYKNTAPIMVYIIGFGILDGKTTVNDRLILNLREQEDWNKIYIDLSDWLIDIAANPNVSGTNVRYEIGFQAELPSDTTAAEYYFDNIKLLTIENVN